MKATHYVKNKDLATYRSFQKVCEREGESVSQKLMIMIYAYMASHGDGNPQTLLDHAGEVRTLPKWKTCRHSQGIRVQGTIFCEASDGRKGIFPGWRLVAACDRCDHYRAAEAEANQE
jgi:hypothetical protein